MKYCCYLVVLLIFSCAQQTLLTGGDKDTSPPVLDSLKTIPNPFVTNFNEREIILSFNENIQLSRAKRSFITSPTINTIETKVNKTNLIINWNDSLRAKTTYQLYFPGSISDITENNSIANFKYVFSTGDELESGAINGKIIEMPQKKMGEDYLVFLQNISDSLLYYKTYSNTNGIFNFNYIAPGNYIIGGYNDKNDNFKLDSLQEAVFFSLDTVKVLADSSIQRTYISFKNQEKISVEKSSLNAYGKIVLEFNQEIDSCTLTDTLTQVQYLSAKKLKKHVFFINDTMDKYFLEVSSPKQRFKEKLILANNNKKIKDYSLTFKEEPKLTLSAPMHYIISFNQYIHSIDTSKIMLYQDSVAIDAIYEKSNQRLIVNPQTIGNLKLVLLPESVTGLKSTKKDTSTIHFTIKDDKSYGELDILIDSLDDGNYILVVSKNDNLKEEFFFSGDSFSTQIKRCETGSYSLKLIEDLDNNKYWSTGDIFNQIQPEKIHLYKDEVSVKKNWTTSINWVF